MYILSNEEELICKGIVDSAFQVHKFLGPGFLEKIYESSFCFELRERGLNYMRQTEMPVIYKNHDLNETMRLDVLVDNK
jgi:GxxExxY protein